MTLPRFVDLRSKYEQVYNQGPNNACGPYALCNALDCLYENALDKPHRFDPLHTWHWSKYWGGFGFGNVGSTHDSLKDSLELSGAKLGDEIIKGFKLVRTRPDVQHFKELLVLGVPIIWLMKCTPEILSGANNGKPWREHVWGKWDLSRQWAMHFVCVMGFDDDAGRWLIENSWGSDGWGDGGFFGIKYDDFLMLSEGFSHIDIAPVLPKPFQGNSVLVTTMTFSEAGDFVDRSKSGLKTLFAEKMSVGGATEVVKLAVSLGVSDKHLEYIFGWPRGAVRKFSKENPSLDWTGFVWDQL